MKIFHRNRVNTRCYRNWGEFSLQFIIFFLIILSAFFFFFLPYGKAQCLSQIWMKWNFYYLISFHSMERTISNASLPWVMLQFKGRMTKTYLDVVKWHQNKSFSICVNTMCFLLISGFFLSSRKYWPLKLRKSYSINLKILRGHNK